MAQKKHFYSFLTILKKNIIHVLKELGKYYEEPHYKKYFKTSKISC